MTRGLLVCLLLSVALSAAQAAAPPPQWLPQDSWPGGKQYDARLEKTVTFWGTGVPAAELFASITKQTGVALGFSPPDDDNARICLNVYLNPKEPPTLRDLLVQLSWVLDCAWAAEGEGEQRRYLLLHTSAASGALADYERWREEALGAREERESRMERDLWQQALARRPELKEALELSREEAVKRYSGDPMLLTLLDPLRRAVARFMLSLPEADLARLGPSSSSEIRWDELTAEQQGWLKEALQPSMRELAAQYASYPRPQFPWQDWDEAMRLGLRLTYHCGTTGLNLEVEPSLPLQEAWAKGWSVSRASTPVATLVADPRAPGGVRAWDAVAVRRLLGEAVSDQQAQELERQAHVQRQRDSFRRATEEQVAQYRRVSAEAATRLSAILLPVKADQPYALWQLQEAVAASSDFSVVSDCTWQPQRMLSPVLALLLSPPAPRPDAFSVLTAACATNSDRISSAMMQPETTTWEWGDAGNVLRFRSIDRALWREAMLPRAVIEALVSLIDPHLPDPAAVGDEPPPITVPVDVRRYAALLADLNRAQVWFGAEINYGDPVAPANAYRKRFWSELFPYYKHVPCRIIASLDAKRWEQLGAEGLVWGMDLRLDPTPLDRDFGWESFHDGDTLRFEVGPPRPGATDGPSRSAELSASRTGYKERYGCDPIQYSLPLSLVVGASIPKHLVPPPPEYAP